jgi:hypothetical protein
MYVHIHIHVYINEYIYKRTYSPVDNSLHLRFSSALRWLTAAFHKHIPLYIHIFIFVSSYFLVITDIRMYMHTYQCDIWLLATTLHKHIPLYIHIFIFVLSYFITFIYVITDIHMRMHTYTNVIYGCWQLHSTITFLYTHV